MIIAAVITWKACVIASGMYDATRYGYLEHSESASNAVPSRLFVVSFLLRYIFGFHDSRDACSVICFATSGHPWVRSYNHYQFIHCRIGGYGCFRRYLQHTAASCSCSIGLLFCRNRILRCEGPLLDSIAAQASQVIWMSVRL